MYRKSMNDLYNRAKVNFIFDCIARGGISTNLEFNFQDSKEIVRVYSNERDAVENFYSDTFVVILLKYPTEIERCSARGWSRVVGSASYQKTGGSKQYALDNPVSPFNNRIAHSYVTILNRDKARPRILQNEIEFPTTPTERCQYKEHQKIMYHVKSLPNSEFIDTPDLNLIRVVIRNYYEKEQRKSKKTKTTKSEETNIKKTTKSKTQSQPQPQSQPQSQSQPYPLSSPKRFVNRASFEDFVIQKVECISRRDKKRGRDREEERDCYRNREIEVAKPQVYDYQVPFNQDVFQHQLNYLYFNNFYNIFRQSQNYNPMDIKNMILP